MNLRPAMTLAAHVAIGKATLPILGSVKFEDGSITATDLDQQIDIPIEGTGLPKSGAFCVSARRLTRLLKGLPEDGNILCLVKDGRLHITCGTARFQLNTLPAADFPLMDCPHDPAAVTVDVAGDAWAKALAFVAPAMANGDIRYYLNGLHIRIGGGAVVLTATDGHRLHRIRVIPDKLSDTGDATGIIGRAAIPRIADLAAAHGTLAITLSGSRLHVESEEELTVKLIDGQFPDADRVIPATRRVTGAVNGKDLAAAMLRVTPITTDDKYQGIRLACHPDLIELETKNSEGEFGAETFPWTAADPAFTNYTTGFNSVYLIEALKAFTTDVVHLHVGANENESLYITDGDAGTRQVVVMPMRI